MTASTDLEDVPAPFSRRRRLGEVLIDQGVLTDEQVQAALAAQSDVEDGQPRKRLGQVVIDLDFATERQIAEALAEALSLPLVDLGRTLVVPEDARVLPRAVAERGGVLVVRREGTRLTVATSDPTNVLALDDVKLYTGASDLTVLVATDSQVRDHLARAWSLSEDSTDMSNLVSDVALHQEEEADSAGDQLVETAPIVRLVDVVLADAVRARASDVHVEPQASDLRIRYRVDGLLRDVMTVPKGATAAAVSRIKILSGLDIAERRRPQDGRAKLSVDGMTVEARISTLPTLHGEKVVIRLLPRAENVPLLTHTGLSERQQELLGHALVQAQGLILITGPTGSGKTNTLYAAIQQVSTPDRNIVTLEDPVEVQVAGITQVQVQDKAGLTFARGLRSVLRQDPDVVLVGEVRDTETAELALQASLTGHLVLTTLHTNDAVSAITRLVDMGVEPFLVASSLSLVVAQRLVRTPCAACTAPYSPDARTLERLGLLPQDLHGATPMRGKGCADCGGTGYKGRVGVYEVLPVSAALRAVLLTNPTEAAIGAAAREAGMLTLRAAALDKAHRGQTTYEEVLRATTVDTVAGPRCPTCARALADDMLCCPWDGSPLQRGLCEGCGKALQDDWLTCPWCRLAREAAPAGVPAPRSAELPGGPTAAVSAAAPTADAGAPDAGAPQAGAPQAGAPDAVVPAVPVAARPAADVPAAAADEAPSASATDSALPTLPTLLVVDDDPSVTAFVTAALTGTATVVGAHDAEGGLAVLAGTPVDAVLLDQGLPDLSGTELVRLLRADPRTLGLPVIMLTGSADPDVLVGAERAGADAVLGKPVEPAELERQVCALLARTARTLPVVRQG